ncbi:hypothetical protein RC55_08140 [Herbaspirillum seropedicae]|nr:hypothetical protein ACP92_12790 [Herbaspirillum seropedicae]NQE29165.1 hypothetical protein [Herbaspirillum seropedicae]
MSMPSRSGARGRVAGSWIAAVGAVVRHRGAGRVTRIGMIMDQGRARAVAAIARQAMRARVSADVPALI